MIRLPQCVVPFEVLFLRRAKASSKLQEFTASCSIYPQLYRPDFPTSLCETTGILSANHGKIEMNSFLILTVELGNQSFHLVASSLSKWLIFWVSNKLGASHWICCLSAVSRFGLLRRFVVISHILYLQDWWTQRVQGLRGDFGKKTNGKPTAKTCKNYTNRNNNHQIQVVVMWMSNPKIFRNNIVLLWIYFGQKLDLIKGPKFLADFSTHPTNLMATPPCCVHGIHIAPMGFFPQEWGWWTFNVLSNSYRNMGFMVCFVLFCII